MEENSQEVTSTPLDLSKKPCTDTSANKQRSPDLKEKMLQYQKELAASALDLRKPVATPVSFHRAIPVTTSVPSKTSHKALVGPETKYIPAHGIERKDEISHRNVQAETTKIGNNQAHGSVVKVVTVQPGYSTNFDAKEQRVVVTAPAETTSKLHPEEIPSIARLSPSTLTYQQQSVMRNMPEIDSVEPPRQLIQGGLPTVIVANSSGYVQIPTESAQLVARTPGQQISIGNISNVSGHGNVVVIPVSELKKIQSLQAGRAAARDEDEPSVTKSKAAEGKRRVHLAPHFQPYPNQRPTVTTVHRSLSIPSHTIQAMSLSPRIPTSASDGSISPGVLVRTTQAGHPASVIQRWSPDGATVSTSSTSDSSMSLTYSVLGKPKVATAPTTEGRDRQDSALPVSKQEVTSSTKTSATQEVVTMPTGVAGPDPESSEGGLPINPFYPLSVAVDCHRATAQDTDGDTPLHIAIVQEQTDLAYIQRLIHLVKMSGKSLDIFNYMQQTPLHLAAITNNIEVIRIMLESGANPNEADRNGQTTIHHACYNRNSPCMSVIFKYSTFKIDLEKKNFNGHSALHVAVDKRDKVLVRMLLENGANVNAMDSRNGWTPLFIAVANQDIGMLGILVEFRAKVNAQSYSGNSALHIATGRGYTDVVKVLVQYGADLSLKNSHWETPVNVANANANEMGQLLRRICRGSPTATLMTPTPMGAEKVQLPTLQPTYPASYSPPPPIQSLAKPSLSSSHEDVRNALSNKIHRKLSRDSLAPSSPVSGRDSPNFRKKVKTTKVVKVAVDGDSFPLGKLTPISDGRKISVITKSKSATGEGEQRLQSSDSGIGSWRTDSDPALKAELEKIIEVKMDTSARIAESVVRMTEEDDDDGDCAMDSLKDEKTMEFTIQSSYQTVSEGSKVKVEKVTSLPVMSVSKGSWENRESMEVDVESTDSNGPNISGPIKTERNSGGKAAAADSSPFRYIMFGPQSGAGSVSTSAREKPEVKKEDPAVSSNSGFDVTAVPVYRKAMQNGQQMSKTKEKILAESAASSSSPMSGRVASSGGLSGTKRPNSQDSEDDEDKLVIVEMRTKPLKKTMSSSCPTSPSISFRSSGNEQRLTPSPKRALET
ncbi:uncharacterized protein [Apostichopus japonicus]|uniref:uncharacterized protein n=1 Tax=Stichopus japonicus TaxID=307972 RepID=UPI003AB2CE8A